MVKLQSAIVAAFYPLDITGFWTYPLPVRSRKYLAVPRRQHLSAIHSAPLSEEGGSFPPKTETSGRSTSPFPVADIAAPSALPQISHLHGVIFDMDGTILKPSIDFAYMRTAVHSIARREVEDGIYPSSSPRTKRVLAGDVLELCKYLSVNGQNEAKKVFAEVERKSIDSMEPADGAVALLNYIDSFPNVKRAILTRNVHSTVEIMERLLGERGCGRGFDIIVARDTVPGLESKPAPDPILYICGKDGWDVDPRHIVMVGDCAEDDVVAGNLAGVGATVLIDTGEDNCSGGGIPPENVRQDEYDRMRDPTVTVSKLESLLSMWSEAEQLMARENAFR